MYTSEKNTKQLTVRGGGPTFTVSLTVKYPGFFFDGFPKCASPINFRSIEIRHFDYQMTGFGQLFFVWMYWKSCFLNSDSSEC